MLMIRRAVMLIAALLLGAYTLPSIASARTFYIVATVPSGTGTVYITGDDPALGPWNPRGAAMTADGDKRIYKIDAPKGMKFSYKFTLGSWDREALGEDGKPRDANYTLTVGDQEIYQHAIPGFKGDPPRTVYIAVNVPAATGVVYITGSAPELGPWNPRGARMAVDGNTRIYAYTAPPGTVLEYKFTLGGWDSEALGADGKPQGANYSLTVGAQQVYLTTIPGFKSGG